MVGMFVCLCLASQKPSEREFFLPAGTHLGVKLLRQSVDANLVIGSPCQDIFRKWKKNRNTARCWLMIYIGCLKAKCRCKLGNWEFMSGKLLCNFFQIGKISRYVTLIPLRNSSYHYYRIVRTSLSHSWFLWTFVTKQLKKGSRILKM